MKYLSIALLFLFFLASSQPFDIFLNIDDDSYGPPFENYIPFLNVSFSENIIGTFDCQDIIWNCEASCEPSCECYLYLKTYYYAENYIICEIVDEIDEYFNNVSLCFQVNAEMYMSEDSNLNAASNELCFDFDPLPQVLKVNLRTRRFPKISHDDYPVVYDVFFTKPCYDYNSTLLKIENPGPGTHFKVFEIIPNIEFFIYVFENFFGGSFTNGLIIDQNFCHDINGRPSSYFKANTSDLITFKPNLFETEMNIAIVSPSWVPRDIHGETRYLPLTYIAQFGSRPIEFTKDHIHKYCNLCNIKVSLIPDTNYTQYLIEVFINFKIQEEYHEFIFKIPSYTVFDLFLRPNTEDIFPPFDDFRFFGFTNINLTIPVHYGEKFVGSPLNNPPPRSNFYFFHSPEENSDIYYLLFGRCGNCENKKDVLNDVWALSENFVWIGGSNLPNEHTDIDNKIVGAREGFGAGYLDYSILIFGGLGYDETGTYDYLNDFFQLQGPETTYIGPNPPPSKNGSLCEEKYVFGHECYPSARTGMLYVNAKSENNSDFIFFGFGYGYNSYSVTQTYYLNDIYGVNAQYEWAFGGGELQGDGTGNYSTYGEFSPFLWPSARTELIFAYNTDDHSNQYIYIYGGYGIDFHGNEGLLNDLWCLDLTNMQWGWLSGSNEANQDASLYGGVGFVDLNRFYIFGGIGIINSEKGFVNFMYYYDLSQDEFVFAGGTNNINSSYSDGFELTYVYPEAIYQPGFFFHKEYKTAVFLYGETSNGYNRSRQVFLFDWEISNVSLSFITPTSSHFIKDAEFSLKFDRDVLIPDLYNENVCKLYLTDSSDDIFQLNSFEDGYQVHQKIACLGENKFVASWDSHTIGFSDTDLYARIFSSDVLAGPEFRVNDITINYQNLSDIASFPDKSFIIIYTSYDGDNAGIFGKIYNEDGNVIVSSYLVNTEITNKQLSAKVAVLHNNKFVVVWTSVNQDGSYEGIYGQMFYFNGDKYLSEFQINSHTDDSQHNPQVLDLKNRFVVVWQSENQLDLDISGIYGQLFSYNGDKIGTEFHVNVSSSSQKKPSLTMLDDGRFVVVAVVANNDYGIYGQIFKPDGSKDGGIFSVVKKTYGRPPSISALKYGYFAVVFAVESIYLQLFDSKANKIGMPRIISSLGDRDIEVYQHVSELCGNNIYASWSWINSESLGIINAKVRKINFECFKFYPDFNVIGSENCYVSKVSTGNSLNELIVTVSSLDEFDGNAIKLQVKDDIHLTDIVGNPYIPSSIVSEPTYLGIFNHWIWLNGDDKMFSPLAVYGANMYFSNTDSDNFYLFGGYSFENSRSNGLWRYNINDKTWFLMKDDEGYNFPDNFGENGYPPRRHHHGGFVDDDGIIYIFGGEFDSDYFNDLWYYNDDKWFWLSGCDSFNSNANFPYPRARSSFAYSLGTNKFFIYGGRNFENSFGDLWYFHLFSKSWTRLENPSGENSVYGDFGDYNAFYHPSFRYGSSMWSFSDISIYLFGGIDSNGAYCRDLWHYNGFFWALIKNSFTNSQISYNYGFSSEFEMFPPPHAYSSMWGINNRLYLFTGGSEHGNLTNEIWIFDIKQNGWGFWQSGNNNDTNNSASENDLEYLYDGYQYPSARLYSSVCFSKTRSKAFLFGGIPYLIDGKNVTNDLYVINIDSSYLEIVSFESSYIGFDTLSVDITFSHPIVEFEPEFSFFLKEFQYTISNYQTTQSITINVDFITNINITLSPGHVWDRFGRTLDKIYEKEFYFKRPFIIEIYPLSPYLSNTLPLEFNIISNSPCYLSSNDIFINNCGNCSKTLIIQPFVGWGNFSEILSAQFKLFVWNVKNNTNIIPYIPSNQIVDYKNNPNLQSFLDYGVNYNSEPPYIIFDIEPPKQIYYQGFFNFEFRFNKKCNGFNPSLHFNDMNDLCTIQDSQIGDKYFIEVKLCQYAIPSYINFNFMDNICMDENGNNFQGHNFNVFLNPKEGQLQWISGTINDISPNFYFGDKFFTNPLNNPGPHYFSSLFSFKNYLFLWGGEAYSTYNPSIAYPMNTLWRYDLFTEDWIWIGGSDQPFNSGNHPEYDLLTYKNHYIPCARTKHSYTYSSTFNSNVVFIFGGSNSTDFFYSDLWGYDLEGDKWAMLKSGYNNFGSYSPAYDDFSFTYFPGAREDAAAFHFSSKFVIYGGYGKSENEIGYLSDLWVYFEHSGWLWTSGSKSANVIDGVDSPGARSKFVYTQQLSNGWLFGGISTEGIHNDLWKLDLSSKVWYLMGGLGINQTSTLNAQYFIPSYKPGGRIYGSMTWSNLNTINSLFLFGGYGLDKTNTTTLSMNDFWRYDIIDQEWHWLRGSDIGNNDDGDYPPSVGHFEGDGFDYWIKQRYGMASTMATFKGPPDMDRIFIYSGKSEKYFLDDLTTIPILHKTPSLSILRTSDQNLFTSSDIISFIFEWSTKMALINIESNIIIIGCTKCTFYYNETSQIVNIDVIEPEINIISVNFPTFVVYDNFGNLHTDGFTSQNIIYDINAPNVTLEILSNPTNNNPIFILAIFSENVRLYSQELGITNCPLCNYNISQPYFNHQDWILVTILVPDNITDSTMDVNILSDTAVDLAGNGNYPSSILTVYYHNITTTITPFESFTNQMPLEYLISFSSEVNFTDINYLQFSCKNNQIVCNDMVNFITFSQISDLEYIVEIDRELEEECITLLIEEGAGSSLTFIDSNITSIKSNNATICIKTKSPEIEDTFQYSYKIFTNHIDQTHCSINTNVTIEFTITTLLDHEPSLIIEGYLYSTNFIYQKFLTWQVYGMGGFNVYSSYFYTFQSNISCSEIFINTNNATLNQIKFIDMYDVFGNSVQNLTFTSAGDFFIIADTYRPILTSVKFSSTGGNEIQIGDQISLFFVSSEKFGSSPNVIIAGQTANIVIIEENKCNATYTLKENDFEGNITYSIDFIDEFGNAGITVTQDNINATIDTIRPILTSVSISSDYGNNNTQAGIGNIISLKFTSGETLGTIPIVTIGGYAADSVSPTENLNEYIANLTIIEDTINNIVSFVITFEDIYGNSESDPVTETTDDSFVIIDTTRPTLTSVSIYSDYGTNNTQAGIGNIISLVFTADEQLLLPIVTIGGYAADSVSPTENLNEYIATLTLIEDTINDIVSFVITFEDIYGNSESVPVTETTDNSEVITDSIRVQMSSIYIESDNINPRDAKIGDSIYVFFTSVEYLLKDPLVFIENIGYIDVVQIDSFNYMASYLLQENDLNGYVTFSINEVYDKFNNSQAPYTSTTDGTFILVDTKRPFLYFIQLFSSHSPTHLAAIDDIVSVRFFIDEDGDPTSVTIAGNSADVVSLPFPNEYLATITLSENTFNGYINFTIEFKDNIGNTGIPISNNTGTDNSKIFADTKYPFITFFNFSTNNYINKSIAGIDDTIYVEFSINEDCGAFLPEVRVNDEESKTMDVYNLGNQLYFGQYTLDSDYFNGYISFFFKFKDFYGNEAYFDSDTDDFGNKILVDSITPSFPFVHISTNSTENPFANIGNNATIFFIVSEPVFNVEVSIDSYSASVIQKGPFEYIASLLLTESSLNGQISFEISVEDLFGNPSTTNDITDGDELDADTIRPVLSPVTILTNHAGNPSLGAIGDLITLTFFALESLGEVPKVDFFDHPSSNVVPTGIPNQWQAEYYIQENDILTTSSAEFVIDFKDTFFNPGLSVTSITHGQNVIVDAIRPIVINATIYSDHSNTSRANSLSTIYIDLVFSEYLEMEPYVQIITNPATIENNNNPEFTAKLKLNCEDCWTGMVTFSVMFQDIYKNTGDTVTSVTDNSFVFGDTSRPTLQDVTIFSNHSDPSKAAIHTKVELHFSIGYEMLGEMPIVLIASEYAYVQDGINFGEYISSIVLEEDSWNGVITFSISFVDDFGNPGYNVYTVNDDSSVTADTIRPILQTVYLLSSHPELGSGKGKIGDNITLIFISTEDLGELPFVTIANIEAYVFYNDYDEYEAHITLLENEYSGTILFSIDFMDTFNNSGIQVTQITTGQNIIADTIRPTLSLVTIYSDHSNSSMASIGNIIYLSFNSSEKLSQINIQIAGYTPIINQKENSFVASLLLGENDFSGDVPFSIDFSDLYQNDGHTVSATLDNSFVIADTNRPILDYVTIYSDHNTSSSIASIDTTISLIFTSDEYLIDIPIVTIDNTIYADVYETSENEYYASFVLSESSLNGLIEFSIFFIDSFGNQGNNVTSVSDSTSVYADTNRPILTNVYMYSDDSTMTGVKIGAIGSNISVIFYPDEALGTFPIVTIANAEASVAFLEHINCFEAYIILHENEYSGIIPFSIDFIDTYGNSGVQVTQITTGENIVADTIRPTLSTVSIYSDHTNTSMASIGNKIYLEFYSSEPLTNIVVNIAGLSSTLNYNDPTHIVASVSLGENDHTGLVPFEIYFFDYYYNEGIDFFEEVNPYTTVTDGSFVITDCQKPSFTNCPSSITISTEEHKDTAHVSWAPPNIFDDYDPFPTYISSHEPNDIFPLGETLVQYTIYDFYLNTNTDCVFTINVVDREPPQILNCPSNVIISTDAGLSTAVFNWTHPLTIDNTDPAPVLSVFSYPTPDLIEPLMSFPLGVTSINYTSIDKLGNINSDCFFLIGVFDTEKPSFTCPNDIRETIGRGEKAKQLFWGTIQGVDNVDGYFFPSITSSPTPFLDSGSNFEVGKHKITYSYTDSYNNHFNCSFNVEILCPKGSTLRVISSVYICADCGINTYMPIDTYIPQNCIDCTQGMYSNEAEERCYWPPSVIDHELSLIEDSPGFGVILPITPGDSGRTDIYVTIVTKPRFGVLLKNPVSNVISSNDTNSNAFDDNAITIVPYTLPLNQIEVYYWPNSNLYSPPVDSFQFTAKDSSNFPANYTATVTLHIIPVNDPPVLSNHKVIIDGTKSIETINLGSSVSDVDNDIGVISFSVVSLPDKGSLVDAVSGNEITENNLPYSLSSQQIFFMPNVNNKDIARDYTNFQIRSYDNANYSNTALVEFEIICVVPNVIFNWATENSNPICVNCPSGAECASDGSVPPQSAEGYWQAGKNIFLECDPPEACPRNAKLGGDCSSGYVGRRCGECAASYYRLSGYCTPCPESTSSVIWIIAAIVICLLVALMVWVATKGPNLGFIAITFTYLQSLAIVAKIRLRWPDNVESVFTSISLFNMNIELMSIECDLPNFRWAQKYLAFFFFPIIVLAVLVIGWLFYSVIIHLIYEIKGGENPHNRTFTVGLLSLKTFILFLMFFYISLASAVVELFDCSKLGDGYYLDADPQTQCYGDVWYSLLPWGIISILLYVVGIPALFIIVLLRRPPYTDKDGNVLSKEWNGMVIPTFMMARLDEAYSTKDNNSDKKDTLKNTISIDELELSNWENKFGSLTVNYNPRTYYWELLNVLRKLGLGLTKIFFSKYAMFQATAVTSIFVVFFTLQNHFQSYRNAQLNRLEFSSLGCSIFILLGGMLCFGEPTLASQIGGVMIVFFAITITVVFYQIIKTIYQNFNEWRKKKTTTNDNNIIKLQIHDMYEMPLDLNTIDEGYSIKNSPIESKEIKQYNIEYNIAPPENDFSELKPETIENEILNSLSNLENKEASYNIESQSPISSNNVLIIPGTITETNNGKKNYLEEDIYE